eukprot:TRINITY_DN18773_c0_g1_i1.p1 TRINITY_DN18773_c0_g1~~TRINITY_DN18773_c0_g1_i1.p1  ORF type:complete len:414 (+),score=98.11 TRINITY_DN18773_c0_g1_i1:55-1296(+)
MDTSKIESHVEDSTPSMTLVADQVTRDLKIEESATSPTSSTPAEKPYKVVVIKIGSSSIVRTKSRDVSLSNLANLVESVIELRKNGFKVVIVSSGAVAVGCIRLQLTERPKVLAKKQAVAAVGQGRLMRIYDDLFGMYHIPIAQVLLTRGDLAEKHQYLNALNTFKELLKYDVIPIVNENDTVSVEELRFGDNDTLSALVACLIEADYLFLLTDVDRLYTADPRSNPNAVPIPLVEDISQLAVDCGDAGTSWGTGGMATKITAARLAVASGVRTIITNGKYPENMVKILVEGSDIGTHFVAKTQKGKWRSRKRWVASLAPQGKIYLDDGAVTAVKNITSLHAVGITKVEGRFPAHSSVQLVSQTSKLEIGRGLVNYNSNEVELLKGKNSHEYEVALGYWGPKTIIDRDNLALL